MNKSIIIIVAVAIVVIILVVFMLNKQKAEQQAQLNNIQNQPVQKDSIFDVLLNTGIGLAGKGIQNKQSGKNIFGYDKKPKDTFDESGYIQGDGWIDLG